MKLSCFTCGATVSSELPEDTVVRGTVECPECAEKKAVTTAENLEILQDINEKLNSLRKVVCGNKE